MCGRQRLVSAEFWAFVGEVEMLQLQRGGENTFKAMLVKHKEVKHGCESLRLCHIKNVAIVDATGPRNAFAAYGTLLKTTLECLKSVVEISCS